MDWVRRLCLLDPCPFSVFFCHKLSIVPHTFPPPISLSFPLSADEVAYFLKEEKGKKERDHGRYEQWLSVRVVS